MTDNKLIQVEPQPLASILLGDGGDVMQAVQARERVLARCRQVAIQQSTPDDWQDFGGKLWPMSGAISKMIHFFGISVYDEAQSWEEGIDEDGPWYLCRYKATFEVRGLGLGPIVATGTAQSRDQFLTATRTGPDLRACVLKKAETNCRARGILTLLGINPTREELAKYWGAEKVGQIGKVAFREGGRGGGTAETMIVPFGKEKGKKLCDASDNTLRWFAEKVLPESLKDPSKAKWKANNEKLLKAVLDEMDQRSGHAPDREPGSDDEPPAEDIGPPAMSDDEAEQAAMDFGG